MLVFHVVYGLRLAANTTLPGLPRSSNVDGVDVRIRLKEQTFPWESSESTDLLDDSSRNPTYDHPNLRVRMLPGGEYFGLFYSDGVRFAVERHGREVWTDWPENYTLEDACTYLIGPVMGFVLRLRGMVCLHASAVAVNDRAIALVGLPGAGKSTAAAAFACAGFPVLCDDVVALSDKEAQFAVQPGYPRVNLWPDSVRSLFGSDNALPRITPTWDKRYMPIGQNGYRFASKPLPLGAIYILEGRDVTLTVPVIEEVSGQEALVTLAANTYVNYLLDQDMRRTEFDMLSRVVSEVPIRRVRPPAEPSAVFRLCEAIASDTRRAMAPVPANATSARG